MKQTVWLMLADRNAPDLFFAVSSVCNLARNSGVLFSSYFETRRNGQLFAESGSTIPGGHHFQDFNYLCAVADVKVIRYGNAYVFDSSIRNFGLEVIAEAERPAELYRQLLDYTGGSFQPGTLYFGLNHPIRNGNGQEIRPEPYQYPEILNTAALAFSPSDGEAAKEFYAEGMAVRSCFCSPEENDSLQKLYPQLEIIDRIQPDDDWRSITLRIAERWKHKAKSVFFGDPDALFCRIPEEARRKSVALYAISKGTPRQRRIRLVWHGRLGTPFSAAVRLWMEIFFSGRGADSVFRSWIRTGPHFRSSTSSRRSGPGQKTKTGISSRTPSPTPPCASGPMRENV